MAKSAHSMFELDPEQLELRNSLCGLLDARAPLEKAREVVRGDPGYDVGLWQELATRHGLLGMAVPEEFGGGGFTFREQGLAVQELGHNLVPGPYFSSGVLATQLILRCSEKAAMQDLLPPIGRGEVVATAILVDETADWSLTRPVIRAEEAGALHCLHGSAAYVLEAQAADLFVVVADDGWGPAVYAADADQPGITVTATPAVDLTRRHASVSLDGVVATRLSPRRSADTSIDEALAVAAIGLACEQVGAARRCLDEATAYARQRHQFGRAIGSFQAIKHLLADAFVSVESSSAAVWHAAWAADSADGNLIAMASLVKAFASDAFFEVARTNVQVHGAIGFTWEHDAHLLLRRAIASRALLGSASHHRERIARTMLFPDGKSSG